MIQYFCFFWKQAPLKSLNLQSIHWSWWRYVRYAVDALGWARGEGDLGGQSSRHRELRQKFVRFILRQFMAYNSAFHGDWNIWNLMWFGKVFFFPAKRGAKNGMMGFTVNPKTDVLAGCLPQVWPTVTWMQRQYSGGMDWGSFFLNFTCFRCFLLSIHRRTTMNQIESMRSMGADCWEPGQPLVV